MWQKQKQARPTSGAVSTTDIGDFLAGDVDKQSVLDKLVSSTVVSQGQAKSTTTTKQVAKESAESKSNEQLLGELTKPVEPAEAVSAKDSHISTSVPVETETDVEDSDQASKRILDALTGKPAEKDQEDNSKASEAGDE